jgi:hypothetical protein
MSVGGRESDTVESLEEACKEQKSPDAAGKSVYYAGIDNDQGEKDPSANAAGGQEKGSGRCGTLADKVPAGMGKRRHQYEDNGEF